jgi:hypothetical protein
MIIKIFFSSLWALLAAAAAPAAAQFAFDVPFVPTPQVVVDEMLRAAGVGPADFVMDLGSGDGRVVITAARKYGARGIGVDLDAELVAQSEENARAAGVADRVRFLNQDLFKTDITQADVITLYLVPSVMMRLRPQLLALKPGTRLVSHDFTLGDWKPDDKTTVRKNVFLWIVPARIEGRWRSRIALPAGERDFEFDLRQKYQEFDGLVRIGRQVHPLWEPRLRGDRIRFVVVDSSDRDDEAGLYFDGRVSGDAIDGEIRRGVGSAQTVLRWRATRVAP